MSSGFNVVDLNQFFNDYVLTGEYLSGHRLYTVDALINPEDMPRSKDDFVGEPYLWLVDIGGTYVLLYDCLEFHNSDNVSMRMSLNTLYSRVYNEQHKKRGRQTDFCYLFYHLDENGSQRPIYLGCNDVHPKYYVCGLGPNSNIKSLYRKVPLDYDVEDDTHKLLGLFNSHPKSLLKSYDDRFHLIEIMGVFERSEDYAW